MLELRTQQHWQEIGNPTQSSPVWHKIVAICANQRQVFVLKAILAIKSAQLEHRRTNYLVKSDYIWIRLFRMIDQPITQPRWEVDEMWIITCKVVDFLILTSRYQSWMNSQQHRWLTCQASIRLQQVSINKQPWIQSSKLSLMRT